MLHMRGFLIRVERMLTDLKKYSEVAFENSRLVETVIRNIVPPTYLNNNQLIDELSVLNDTQKLAVKSALSVSL